MCTGSSAARVPKIASKHSLQFLEFIEALEFLAFIGRIVFIAFIEFIAFIAFIEPFFGCVVLRAVAFTIANLKGHSSR